MNELKRKIYKSGENLQTFADKVGLSRFTIMNVIKGRYKSANGATIKLIADGLGMTYEETEKLINVSC